MCMIRCDRCNAVCDSDADPDCFVEVGNMRAQTRDEVWCECCREAAIDELEIAGSGVLK